MFDYKGYFDKYCIDNGLDLLLSFDMPLGCETANGTFDVALKTVFINAEYLDEAPDYEKAFYFFHELRHASQYLCPDQFISAINRSMQYIIMYGGTCYKLVDGKYIECKLDGSKEYLTNPYLGQPHELGANTFAYEQVKMLYGDSESLKELYESWIPRMSLPIETYEAVFATIDEKTKSQNTTLKSYLSGQTAVK